MTRDDARRDARDATRALTTANAPLDASTRANDLDGVFSTRKPKDLGAGLSSGLQSAAKSVALGAGALLAAPAIGAREDGARGFVKGLGLGIASAVVLPVVGASVGVAQIARGAANTPSAMAARARGERFDRTTREWVAEDLGREAIFLGETSDEAIFERAVRRAEMRGARTGDRRLARGGDGIERRRREGDGVLRRSGGRADGDERGDTAEILPVGAKDASG